MEIQDNYSFVDDHPEKSNELYKMSLTQKNPVLNLLSEIRVSQVNNY